MAGVASHGSQGRGSLVTAVLAGVGSQGSQGRGITSHGSHDKG